MKATLEVNKAVWRITVVRDAVKQTIDGDNARTPSALGATATVTSAETQRVHKRRDIQPADVEMQGGEDEARLMGGVI